MIANNESFLYSQDSCLEYESRRDAFYGGRKNGSSWKMGNC